ncbi:MAG: pilus assembly protein [Acidimicrobiaceae bacterium]|nr:pilus assembly protein [Acidimicrobiaceae bacterium]
MAAQQDGGHGRRHGRVTGAGPRHRPRPSRQAGQATVEFVLVMPFFALMLLAVVQVGLLVRARVLVTHAAREAVRSAAVGVADGEVRAAALAAADLDPRRLRVSVRRANGRATVELRYAEPTDVPLVGSLVGDAVFEARATMRLEQPVR